MSTLDFVIGVVLILLGVLFYAFAERIIPLFNWESRRMQLTRSLLAIVVGIGLLLVASASSSPDWFRLMGTMVVVGGIALMLMPLRLWASLARWFTKDHLTFYRVATLTVLTMLGGAIVYSAFP